MRVLIFGVTGQDGSLLANLLLRQGFEVFGTYRTESDTAIWRLQHLNIQHSVDMIECDIRDLGDVRNAFDRSRPDLVFNTAGLSHTASSWQRLPKLAETNFVGAANVISYAREMVTVPRVVFFGSSEVFGYSSRPNRMVDERTPPSPSNPYGFIKSHVSDLIATFRSKEELPFYESVLFPHESVLRDDKFLVPKALKALVAAHLDRSIGRAPEFGSLSSSRDWGSAEGHMGRLIEMSLRAPPDRYLIGAGMSYTVRDVFDLGAKSLGRKLVYEDEGGLTTIRFQDRAEPLAYAGGLQLGNEGHGAIAKNASLNTHIGEYEPEPLGDIVASIGKHYLQGLS